MRSRERHEAMGCEGFKAGEEIATSSTAVVDSVRLEKDSVAEHFIM